MVLTSARAGWGKKWGADGEVPGGGQCLSGCPQDYSTRSLGRVPWGTGRREEFRETVLEAKGAEDKQLQPEDSPGSSGEGGEGGVTGLSSSISATQLGGQPALPPTAPFKHPQLGQQHGFQGNQVQRQAPPMEQEGQGHPKSMGGTPGVQAAPGTAMEMSGRCASLPGLGVLAACTQAAVAIVHQEVSPRGSAAVRIVHTASRRSRHPSPSLGLCEPVGVETMGQ